MHTFNVPAAARKDKKRLRIALVTVALATLGLSLANAQTAVIAGTDGNDELIGTDGDDTINGRHGVDMMMGLAGNDTYIVDTSEDEVVEQADEGTDTVRLFWRYTLPANVENLFSAGTQGRWARGNDLANRMVGNSGDDRFGGGRGDDILQGRGGRDHLSGGPGNDILTGGEGPDEFLFTEHGGDGGADADLITDFDSHHDKIGLAFWHGWSPLGIYMGLEVLKPSQFIVGPSATTPEQRIVYNPENGWLYLDWDGSGPNYPAIRLAKLSPHLALTNKHFITYIHAVPASGP